MDPGQILLVTAAVLIGYFAKGATGIGGPLLAIPVLAGFMGTEFAVTVIAIPTLAANTWLLWKTREGAAHVWWFMGPLMIGGVIGTVIGAWILTSVDDRPVSIALAALVGAYVIWYLFGPEVKLSHRLAKWLSAPVGLVSGALVGATGISAPVIATYVHALDLARKAFIFALTITFWVLGVVQVISYVSLGAYDQDRLVAGLIATIPTMAVLPLATWAGEKMSHKTFQNVALVILVVSAVRLVWSVM